MTPHIMTLKSRPLEEHYKAKRDPVIDDDLGTSVWQLQLAGKRQVYATVQ